MSFTFSRSVPFAAAFADQMTIALGDTAEGSYTVTLVVKDKVGGGVATRTTHIVISR